MAKKIRFLDGGMGRELQRIGAPFRQPEWSAFSLMKAPELVRQVHENFLEAGAEILTTNSYAVVPFHLGRERFEREGRELATLSGQLAAAARDRFLKEKKERDGERLEDKISIAGGLPPLFGSYATERFEEENAARYADTLIEALEPFCDLWLVETLSTWQETECYLQRLQKRASQKPIYLSFAVSPKEEAQGEEILLCGNERLSAVLQRVAQWREESQESERLAGILLNCSPPQRISQGIKILADSPLRDLPYGGYANAFNPKPENKKANSGVTTMNEELTPQRYANFAQEWVSDGSSLLGGCCGIGPEHIRKLRESFGEL